MQCRLGCAACCIAPSISTSFVGYPNGKPAGVACKHLDDNLMCSLFDSDARPNVCKNFPAEIDVCGDSREFALKQLIYLERTTQ